MSAVLAVLAGAAAQASGGGGSSSLVWDTVSGQASDWTFSDSNRRASTSLNVNAYMFSSVFKSTGKWFTVVRIVDFQNDNTYTGLGFFSNVGYPPSAQLVQTASGAANGSNFSGTLPTFTAGLGIDIDIHVAVDMDAKKGWVGIGSLPGNPAAGTGNNLNWSGTYNFTVGGYRNNNGANLLTLQLYDTLPAAPPAGFSVFQ